jgi:hypothetical protein
MRGQVQQVRVAKGMQQQLPQPPDSATLIENWTVDQRTGALSSRLGYEKYRVDATDKFVPFATTKRIDSIYVLQQQPGGARQSILFETGGFLYLYYEVGQAASLVELAAGRNIPTPTQAGSVYCQVGRKVVVTNGVDAPVIVDPWPLPDSSSINANIRDSLIRPVGFAGRPSPPEAMRVTNVQYSPDTTMSIASADDVGADTLSLWTTTGSQTVGAPNRFGMGTPSALAVGTGGSNNDDVIRQDSRNAFKFKVAYVSDTGSVGPSSGEVTAQWSIPIVGGQGAYDGFRYSPTLRIPPGPPGTAARRIYATQNKGQQFFFVDDVRNNTELLYHATRRDSTFSVAAPSDLDTVPMPASAAKVCASYQGCLWLDGGTADPSRLYYSHPGLPDQFGGADYLNLNSRGGAVVGMAQHYNVLLVLREQGIDIVTGSYPNFTAQTITDQVACRSPHSIDIIPGVGTVFLAEDQVYAIKGGVVGGSQVQLVPLGQPIREALQRLTRTCAHRAVGRYSPRTQEYHLYIPADGNDRPNLGLVYHIVRGWSVRTGFPVGCIDRLHNGTLLFGHHTGAEAGANSEAGLFVISAKRAMGGKIESDAYVTNNPPTSVYESAWLDMGDAQIKKQVQYVTLWIQTTGDVKLNLAHFKDFGYTEVGTNKTYLAQPADTASQPVLDTGLVGTAKWQRAQLVPVRISVAQQSCSWFKFRLETTDDIMFVGYEIDYQSRGVRVIAGKTA